jgi:hypothetical protein
MTPIAHFTLATCRRGAAAALALTPLLLGGCATLFTGTTDRITFESNVERVRLTIDGEPRGELPLTLELSRYVPGDKVVARFERVGYLPQEFELTREFNPVALLDIPVFVIGFPLDFVSGSIRRFEPASYHVQLVPDPRASPEEIVPRGH